MFGQQRIGVADRGDLMQLASGGTEHAQGGAADMAWMTSKEQPTDEALHGVDFHRSRHALPALHAADSDPVLFD